MVVLLYEFSQDRLGVGRALLWPRQLGDEDRHPADRTRGLPSTAPCPPGSWLRGNICVDIDICRISLVTTSSRDATPPTSSCTRTASVCLSRTGLATAATRRMMFGERVRLGTAAEREIGWWYVQVVEHDDEPCVLWYNGTCWPCAAHDRCDVLPAQRCEVRGGRGRCACIDGFRGNTDQSCRVCPAGQSFCRGGFARACPAAQPHALDGSTACRCDPGSTAPPTTLATGVRIIFIARTKPGTHAPITGRRCKPGSRPRRRVNARPARR